jgi:hypothetical protein
MLGLNHFFQLAQPEFAIGMLQLGGLMLLM